VIFRIRVEIKRSIKKAGGFAKKRSAKEKDANIKVGKVICPFIS
jgi:hypothetical protein